MGLTFCETESHFWRERERERGEDRGEREFEGEREYLVVGVLRVMKAERIFSRCLLVCVVSVCFILCFAFALWMLPSI